MLRVTLRGLRSHVARLVLTAVVVTISVAFVAGAQVLTDTVKDGFDQVFSEVYAGTDAVVRSSDTITTFVSERRAPVSESLLPAVRATPGVAAAEGAIQQPVRLVGKDGKAVRSQGGPPTFGLNWMTTPRLNHWHLVAGRPPEADDEVVIDQKFSEDAGFVVGDALRIPLAGGTLSFTVVGVARFNTNPNFSGATAVLFSTPAAQRYLVAPGQFDRLSVVAADGVGQDELAARLATSLHDTANVQVLTGEAFTKENQDLFQKALDLLNQVLRVFGLVALFVSTFIIYNTFSLIVAQRTRELALLRAVGASRRQVVLSVVTQAFAIGAVASALGIVVGIAFGWLISAFLASIGFVPTNSSLTVRPLALVPGLVVGVVVTVVSGLIPAWRASRIPPVAAMRDHRLEHTRFSPVRVATGIVLVAIGGVLMAVALVTKPDRALTMVGVGMGSVFAGVAVLAPAFVSPMSSLLGAVPAALRGITGRLARENARRNPKRTAATTSAVMIAVALVGFIAIVGESFRVATIDAIDRAVLGDFVVNSNDVGFGGVSPMLTSQLNESDVVQAAAGLRVGVGTADGASTLFLGIDPARMQQVIKIEVTSGSLDALGLDGVAISKKTADDDHLGVGDTIRAHFLTGGDAQLVVRGVFDTELLQGNNGLLISQELFEQVFPAAAQIDLQVYVKLKPDVEPAAAKAALQPVVAQFPPAQLQDLTEFKKARTEPIQRFVTFIWALLLMAVLISAVGILNTLLLSVFERTRELGLLRAAGMSRRQVRSSVDWEAVIISIMGTLLGLAIGLLFGWALVKALAEEGLDAFAVPYGQLAIIVGVAGAIGVVAALLPARRAANLDVLAAIATE
jgi:putative ABC transport system permease protein